MLPLLVALLLAAPVDGPQAHVPVPTDSPRTPARAPPPVPADSLPAPIRTAPPVRTASLPTPARAVPPVPADSLTAPIRTAPPVRAASLPTPARAVPPVPADSLTAPIRTAAAPGSSSRGVPPAPADSPAPPVPPDSPAPPVPSDIPPVDPAPVPPDSPPADLAPDPPDIPPAAPVAGEPTYRRDDPRPTLRAGFGAGIGPRGAPATGVGAGFSFDLALGATIQVHRRVYLWPELGYSLALRDDRTGHFFIAGLSPMFGTYFAQVGLAPRLVAGSAWGVGGVGVRSGVVASVIQGLFSLELGHQWIRAGGRDIHDGRFMLSVDLVVGAAVFVFARGVGRFLRKLG